MDDGTTWQPTATCAALEHRSEVVWRVREFFHQQGVMEVHVPVLSHDTVVDLHIEPVRLAADALACPEAGTRELYLQTSPEFAMKRLLAAGLQAIYSIGPVFRAGERGAYHNPEFTMVEWYRVGDDLAAGIALLDRLVQAAIGTGPAQKRKYQQVFLDFARIDPLTATVQELAALGVALKLGVTQDWSNDRDAWLDLLFSEVIQPQLGLEQPTIVSHYPASQSALARLSDEDPRTAERFELFIGGIELANGYHELLDAAELELRNQGTELKRRLSGKTPLPVSSRLIGAMRAGVPACSGCALGLDRLLMVAMQVQSIDQVLAFPLERA